MCLKEAARLGSLVISKPIGPGHPQAPMLLMQSKRDAIRLYRDCLKSIKSFQWNDQNGTPWAGTLKTSVRDEFEAARHEDDPDLVRRLLITGRDSLIKVEDKLNDKYHKMVEHVDKTRTDRRP